MTCHKDSLLGNLPPDSSLKKYHIQVGIGPHGMFIDSELKHPNLKHLSIISYI